MGWEVVGRIKRQGTCIYLWLIHVDVWQKPRQYCKEIILQFKISKLKKKKKGMWCYRLDICVSPNPYVKF